jgi:hypothetical protein
MLDACEHESRLFNGRAGRIKFHLPGIVEADHSKRRKYPHLITLFLSTLANKSDLALSRH